MVFTFSNTLSEVVANTNSDTLRCVKAKAPGKTEDNTVAGLLEEIEAENVLGDSGLCRGEGTCHYDALKPLRGRGGHVRCAD